MNHVTILLQNSTSTNEYLDELNSFPYIVQMYDGDSKVVSTYVVVVEQDTLTKCRDLTTLLYVTFSAHYISYQTRLKELFRFIQEVIMEIIDNEKSQLLFLIFAVL